VLLEALALVLERAGELLWIHVTGDLEPAGAGGGIAGDGADATGGVGGEALPHGLVELGEGVERHAERVLALGRATGPAQDVPREGPRRVEARASPEFLATHEGEPS